MIIAALVMIFFVLLFFERRLRPQIVFLALSFMIYSLLWLFVLQIELSSFSPDGTYGSDARYYWNAMVNVLQGQSSPGEYDGRLYVLWGYLVLATSPNTSVAWVKISNIILATLSFVLIYLAAYYALSAESREILLKKYTTFLIAFANMNSIIVWMAIRNLKESLILFFFAFAAYLIERTRSWCYSRRLVLLSLVTGGVYVALNGLRPGGGFLIILYLLVSTFFHPNASFTSKIGPKVRTRGSTKHAIGFGLAIVCFYLFAGHRIYHLLDMFSTSFRNVYGDDFLLGLPTVLQLPAALARFVLGPGPFRALEQLITGEIFVVSSKVGDVLIFIGALQWWMMLGLLLLLLIFKRRTVTKFLTSYKALLSVALTVVIVYSYIYAGTGDTRHRALFYALINQPIVLGLASGLRRNFLGS